MFITIEFESDIPIYTQIRNEIIKAIARGELVEGDQLPSVRQLGEDIGVNMHTVNKAYNILKHEGFLTVDRRRGAVISYINGENDLIFRDKLLEELDPMIAEAYCKKISEEEFYDMVIKLYKGYKKEEM